MEKVASRDGTRIAFDRRGEGPSLITVTGALGDRRTHTGLAELLSRSFTVFSYDRRGRGDSGDAEAYAKDREVEDLEAMIEVAGGVAYVYGHSSGAALALESAVRGLPITKLALYEPPYIVDDSRPPLGDDYIPTLRSLAAEGRRAEAVEYFWRVALRMPEEAIAQARAWSGFAGIEALGHTLSYDGEIMDGRMAGEPLPREWARVTVPALVIDGGDSPASMRNAAAAVATLLPGARAVTLPGQGHGAPAEMLAAVLEPFFAG